MNEVLHIILFNVIIFFIVFSILKFYDKKMGENAVGTLKVIYIISMGFSIFVANSLIKQQVELPITATNVLILALMLMIPFSFIMNFGYILSIIIKAMRKKKK